MNQSFEAENDTDADGMPFGGHVRARGLSIDWQMGPLGRGVERIEPNGAFAETVIAAAKQRIEWYQEVADGRFSCMENAAAIDYLAEALRVLESRTASREARQVEGTHAR